MLTLSIICALFVYMVDYGLGHPADEKPGYGSFLFFVSFAFAKRRLDKAGLLRKLNRQYFTQLLDKNDLEAHRVKRSFQEIVFTQGRELFTWEKATGMCPYCFHFWVSLVFMTTANIFYFKENIITFIFYFLLSHLIIRFIKKWI